MLTTRIKFQPLASNLKKGGVVPSINDGNHRWFLVPHWKPLGQ